MLKFLFGIHPHYHALFMSVLPPEAIFHPLVCITIVGLYFSPNLNVNVGSLYGCDLGGKDTQPLALKCTVSTVNSNSLCSSVYQHLQGQGGHLLTAF